MDAKYNGMFRRWGDLCNWEKYGYQPANVATDICSLLIQLAETGTANHLSEAQESLLLGFEVNTGYTAEDGFSFVHCLDLHSVTVDAVMLSDLDSYFMEEVKVNGLSFWDRYRPTLPRK